VALDSFSGYTDYSVQNAANTNSLVTSGAPLSGSESSSTGQLTLYGLVAQSGQAAPNPQAASSFGYWVIDNRRVIAIELDGQQSGVMMLEGTQPN